MNENNGDASGRTCQARLTACLTGQNAKMQTYTDLTFLLIYMVLNKYHITSKPLNTFQFVTKKLK